MYILGLSVLGETAATLIKDGDLISAVEEERFDGERHSTAFPIQAIEFCLEEAGIGLQDVDYIGVNYRPVLGWHWAPFFLRRLPHSLRLFRSKIDSQASSFMGHARMLKTLAPDTKFKLLYLDHHELHAASAFFVSPYEEAAVFTVDAMGEWNTTTLSHGTGNHIRSLAKIQFPHSLGFLYSAITDYVGFVMGKHEGKVMGLAGYGEPEYLEEFSKFVKLLPDGGFEIDQSYFDYSFGWHHKPLMSKKFIERFGPPRGDGEELTQRDRDMAASVQALLEKIALHIVGRLHELTKVKNLCMAGGVALNCVMNTRLLKETPFEDMFVQPATNDAGTSLGAAYHIYHRVLGKERRFRMDHAYWGPAYNEDQIKAALDDAGLSYSRHDDIHERTAKLLTEGKIVGWFQGAMEFGPRSLGNRSILADPRSEKNKVVINEKVKFREAFRPFAPAVLEHATGDFFDLSMASPYMLHSYMVRPEMQKHIPAVTHVDGSARVQTVSAETNADFFKLIEAFEARTGVPVLLNTSLNIKGKPIAREPNDAIRCYLQSDMDLLVLGPYMLAKP